MTSGITGQHPVGLKQYFIQEDDTSQFCFVACKLRDQLCSKTGRLVNEGGDCSYQQGTFVVSVWMLRSNRTPKNSVSDTGS